MAVTRTQDLIDMLYYGAMGYNTSGPNGTDMAEDWRKELQAIADKTLPRCGLTERDWALLMGKESYYLCP